MILYYTRSQKTKVFAEALGEILSQPVCELESDINEIKNLKFLAKALGMVFSGKEYPVSNMPKDLPAEIYVCFPIWGGRLVGPAKYFLQNANLGKTKVNLLMTASTPVEKYRTRALDELAKINCIPGEAYIFATSEGLPEMDVAIEHLREVLGLPV